MFDGTARMLATLGVWASVAVVLTLGLFRVDYHSDTGVFWCVVMVAVICGAAASATAAIWKTRPAPDRPTPPSL